MDGNSTSPASTSRARALPPLHAVERGGTTESRAGQIMAVAGPFCSSGLQITKLPDGCRSVVELIERGEDETGDGTCPRSALCFANGVKADGENGENDGGPAMVPPAP